MKFDSNLGAKMKARVFMAVAALVPGMFLMQASGGTAVAVVDFQRAVAETPEGKAAIAKLTTFGTEQQTAINKKIKEADDLEARIKAQDSLRSEAARTQLAHDLDAARANIQSLGQDAQDKFDQMQEQLLKPVQVKTASAVRGYASEHGFKIVLDASVLQDGLFYVHDTADITSEIIRRIAADINKSGAQNASVVESPQEKSLHRMWSNVNFAQPVATPAPVFPILPAIKMARITN
jgi:Skp family chaperone for outer membrane proteins